MTKKKAFIFDMDGTIVDNIAFHQQAWLQFLAKYDIDLSSENFSAQNHGTADEMMKRFFGSGLSADRITALGLEKEEIYRQLYKPHISEVKGVSRLIKRAHSEGTKIGMATMGNSDNIDLILDALGLKEFFDVIVGGHEVVEGKPAPEIYKKVLSKLNLSCEDCLAFEDSFGGIRSAQLSGIETVGVGTSHGQTEFNLWGVEKYIDDFDDFYRQYFFSCQA